MRHGRRLGTIALALAGGVGCRTRERLITEAPPDGVGPRTLILAPSADTIVSGAGGVSVSGLSADADGVDTVYWALTGAGESFPPFSPLPVKDTVRWAIPLLIGSRLSDTIVVRAFATDVLGNRGDTAIRTIIVR